MTLPEEQGLSNRGKIGLLALIEQAREATLTALDSLKQGDIVAVGESVRRRGTLLERAAEECRQLSFDAPMSATQTEYRGHIRCEALRLKESDEGLRGALEIEKKKVAEQIQNLGRRRQILQYAQPAETMKIDP